MPTSQDQDSQQGWLQLGARLRAAREAAGLRQEDVADLLEISRPTLSAMEAGKTRINSLVLQRLASLYRQELGYFFGKPVSPAPTDQALFAQLGSISLHDRVTIARFLDFCNHLARLQSLLSRPRRELPPPRPCPAAARKYAAEAAAAEERARLGLGDSTVGERLFDLLDVAGLPTYRAPLEDRDVSGLLLHHPTAGPIVFVSSSQHPWRQAFTAAHEYGHLLLQPHPHHTHPSQQPWVCRVFAPDGGARAVIEELVNAFASEFLMPEVGIKRFLVAIGAAPRPLEPRDVARLQRHFGVSFDAMLYRLLRLRLVREVDVPPLRAAARSAALLWPGEDPSTRRATGGRSPGGPGEGEETEDDLDPRERFPASYVELVLEALERGLISNGKAAELLELNRGAFDCFFRLRRQAAEASPPEEGLEHVVA